MLTAPQEAILDRVLVLLEFEGFTNSESNLSLLALTKAVVVISVVVVLQSDAGAAAGEACETSRGSAVPGPRSHRPVW